MFGKRSVAFLLLLSIISSTLYSPIFAPRAHAFLGFGDLVIDIKALAERIVDGIAMAAAQRLVDQMVRSTVNWAQSGFEGNPAYVTDPEQYFRDISDGIAGEFIAGSDLGFLCSPFQTQIRLALRNNYLDEPQYQCTLTDAVGNVEAFYDDFEQGGWDTWFAMTQNNSNNPYGAYLEAQAELDSRIAEAAGLQREQLDWNSGFLSWSDCTETNPPMWIDNPTPPGGLPSRSINPRHVAGKAESECIKRGPTKTPGSVIQEQLNEVLPSGLKKLQVAQHVNQLISAFASGLLNRYVFGSEGLFNRRPNRDSATQPTIPEPSPCEIDPSIPACNQPAPEPPPENNEPFTP